ncbi:MAG TPA: efflux transporter outer membrane subunit [Acidisoma sp.]|jgi:NodT family efflux transporter outer membrane factor (OMF) lipoprotein|uniref:efflux transporter outer membrane subunit n=1 Tax=Acidisoma sp. TaxID=1872115 RepID=UPI002B5BC774|nr:efflux transporter outer membrane subunit [Acidisoma sp.]HTI01511.1 efflux transporter outer membrane subunit [Acidisoma sp.]
MRQALTKARAGLAWPVVSTASLVLLAGCTLGPDFHKPTPPYDPYSFLSGRSPADGASQPQVAPIEVTWWKSFDDPELDSLIKRAIAQNLDVKTATIRLAEARSNAGVTASAFFPSVNGNATAADIKLSDKGGSLLGGGSSSSSSGGSSSGSSSIDPMSIYQYGFDATWTLDIFGKVRRQVEAGNAAIQASEIDRRGVLIQMMAEVARDYVQLRNAQMQLQIAEDNVHTAQRLLNLTRQRATAGLTDQLDVAQEQAQLTTTEATVPQAQQQVAQYINALSMLLGEAPRALQSELVTPKAVPPTPTAIPVGLPSELLRRRPDIMEAEANLHQATANIGVAVASFFPSFNLLGVFGIESNATQDLFTTAARTYVLGGMVQVPIFQGGKLVEQLHLAKERQKEAMVTYDKTVLQAFSDVDNALTDYDKEQQRRRLLKRAVAANQHAFALAQDRYTQGIATYIDVLNAQQNVLTSQRQLQDSTAAVSTDLVSLYLALGGGWEDTFPTPANEAEPNASVGQTIKTAITGGNAS